MSITNDNPAVLNNGTSIDSPRTVVKVANSKAHTSPAAHMGPPTPNQSQVQSATVAECPPMVDFCRDIATAPVGVVPQPEPSTPGSALAERFTEHAHAPDSSGKQNGNCSERPDVLSQTRLPGDECNVSQPAAVPASASDVTLPSAALSDLRRTSPGIQAPPITSVCGPEPLAVSPNLPPSNKQSSPLAVAPAAAPANYSRAQQRPAPGNGPPSGAVPRAPAPNLPAPERLPIWVFTSALANEAVNVVYSGGCRSLAEFHFQKVGHRFVPPPGPVKGFGPPRPGTNDSKQRFVAPPTAAHGPGRPAPSYPPAPGNAPPANDKSNRTAQWVAQQQDTVESTHDDEILKQRPEKMARLEELKRKLKVEDSGSAPQTRIKQEPASGNPTNAFGSAVPATSGPQVSDPSQAQAGSEWSETKPEVSADLSEIKTETDAPAPQPQPQASIHSQPTFARPQSAPSAGPSPSPATASIQSPGSLNEATIALSSSVPTGANKRRQSATNQDKGESQSKSKRRKNSARSNQPEPVTDVMMPPMDMSAKSPGCYSQPRGPLTPGSMMPPGSAPDMALSGAAPRRGNSVGASAPSADSAAPLTSTSLSKLAEMTYSMSPQSHGAPGVGPLPPNGMPPPPSAMSRSTSFEDAMRFASPPSNVCPPQMQPGSLSYDPRTNMMRPGPPDSMAPPYPVMNNRPPPNGPQQPGNLPQQQAPVGSTIINAHMNIHQMNIQSVNASPGVSIVHIQQDLPPGAMQNNMQQHPGARIAYGVPPGNQPNSMMQSPALQPPNRFNAPPGAYDAPNANNANVQIQPKAPNTIQYRPLATERPQRPDVGPNSVRMNDFRAQQAQDFFKMPPGPKMLPPGYPMPPDDPRFAQVPPGVMMNGAPPSVQPPYPRPPHHLNPGSYAQMNDMQQSGNVLCYVGSPPGCPDFGYRNAPNQQQFVPGAPPPNNMQPAPFNSQYPPNAQMRPPTNPTVQQQQQQQQQDANMMNMNVGQQNVKVSMNMYVHAPSQVAQANEAQQINMQMQMNTAQAQQQASFGAPQQQPPQSGNNSCFGVDDADLEFLMQCSNAGSNAGAPSGFFGNSGVSNVLDDVDLLVQQYANANGASPAPGSMMQQQQAPQSVNMSMSMNMSMPQGALRPPADSFGANRFAYPNPNQNPAMNMNMNAGPMQPGAQGPMGRFRPPVPPGMPLEMHLAQGGPPMMGMPMMGDQAPSFDQPSQHLYY